MIDIDKFIESLEPIIRWPEHKLLCYTSDEIRTKLSQALAQQESLPVCTRCEGRGFVTVGDGYSIDACPLCQQESNPRGQAQMSALMKITADLSCCGPLSDIEEILEQSSRTVGFRKIRHATDLAAEKMRVAAVHLRDIFDGLCRKVTEPTNYSDVNVELLARRYRRLQILGCAPMGYTGLAQGLVMRFQSLDAFIDHDIERFPSRGEAIVRAESAQQEQPVQTFPPDYPSGPDREPAQVCECCRGPDWLNICRDCGGRIITKDQL